MKVLVSGLCHAPVIANMLNHLIPDWTFEPFVSYSPLDDVDYSALLNKLSSSDGWVSGLSYPKDPLLTSTISAHKYYIQFPVLSFGGFHPDLCDIYSLSSGKSLRLNSQIGTWCYKNSVDIPTAAQLFTSDIFQQLGFYNAWTVA